MTTQGRKQDVELVEGDDVELDDLIAPVPGGGRAPRDPWTWRRIVRVWPIAVVVLLVAAAYAVAGARDRAEAERLREALRGQPGFLADLSTPMREVWSLDREGAWAYATAVAGDVAIVTTSTDEGVDAVEGVDLATGTQRWVVPTERDTGRHCNAEPLVGYESGPVITCLVRDLTHVSGFVLAIDVDAMGGSLSRVEHRDAATGSLLASSDNRSAVASAVWGADLVEIVAADGGTQLRRVSLDGNVRWSTTVSDAESAAHDYAHLYVVHDVAALTLGPHAIVVDAEGQILVDRPLDDDSVMTMGDGTGEMFYYGSVELLPRGGSVISSTTSTIRSWLYGKDGELRLEWENGSYALALDDGSLGDIAVVYTAGNGVTLHDLVTGAALIDLKAVVETQAFVLDGHLIGGRDQELVSLDVATGEERWAVPFSGHLIGSDGRSLLVSPYRDVGDAVEYPEEPGRYPSRVQAIDLATGEVQWETEIGADSWPIVIDGHVFVVGDQSFSRVAP